MIVEYECLNCKKKFLDTKSAQRKFCSTDCLNEYRRNHPEARAKRGAGSGKIKVKCAECGKEELVPKSRALKYVCCSVGCSVAYRIKAQSKKVEKICPICGEHFFVKKSQEKRRKCCSNTCSAKYRAIHFCGENNGNYRGYIIENGIKSKTYKRYKEPYRKIARDVLGVKEVPKGYDIHHKNADENDNSVNNLVVLPRNAHMLIHRWFGNILINALHTGKITKEIFFSMCNEEQANFYKEIIDLDITRQKVVRINELPKTNENISQEQTSIYQNIIEKISEDKN